MAFNIHNRNLLSLEHHSTRELRYLLDLSRDLKRCQVHRHRAAAPERQQYRADLRKNLYPYPLRLRSGRL
jgi:ornithine carbamoyltransferase (EC 2.1.3.3)